MHVYLIIVYEYNILAKKSHDSPFGICLFYHIRLFIEKRRGKHRPKKNPGLSRYYPGILPSRLVRPNEKYTFLKVHF